MQLVSQMLVLPAPGKAQQQQPTCLEPALHTMEELQVMSRPLKATLAVLSQHDSCSAEAAEVAPASPMLLCHLRHMERCHPRLWIKQQQHQPDLWCGAVPKTPRGGTSPDNITDSNSPAGSSSCCWQWLSKCAEAQEFLTGLAVLRSDLTNSSSSTDTSSTTAEGSTLIINARLNAYESALSLLSAQLASLVSGAAAVKVALRAAGLLPVDGRSIRVALQEATGGKLAEWARQGLQQAHDLAGAQGVDTDWMMVVADGLLKE